MILELKLYSDLLTSVSSLTIKHDDLRNLQVLEYNYFYRYIIGGPI